MNDNSTAVFAVIQKIGKATMQQISDELRDMTYNEVENAIKTLRKSKKVQNISDQAHVAIYTSDMNAVSLYRPSKERDPMTEKPLKNAVAQSHQAYLSTECQASTFRHAPSPCAPAPWITRPA